jgi:uncharacterized protein YgbK (DUF1537 family)
LAGLAGNVVVAVDATEPCHLSALAAAVRDLQVSAVPPESAPAAGLAAGVAAAAGNRPRRFLFQSAAGLIAALADLPPQPRDGAALATLRRRGGDGPLPGLVLVGSHVPLADRQLALLLAEERCSGVEVAVAKVQRSLEGPVPDLLLASLESAWLEQLRQQLAAGRTPVLYTSRGERRCRDGAERRRLGLVLAGSMARLGAALAPELGYVICKGGITTQTLLADGFDLAAVQLQGQLLPGLSLVLADLPAAKPGEAQASLPVLTFPGNLGDDDTLRSAWCWMEG